tara:strand:+ start:301 stop:570 length:270 start_codon:yes stop_codon:yes gene_type:complete
MSLYFDYNLLKNANDKAVKLGFNRAIEDEFFEDIDPKTLFPVVFAMDHNDGAEMRVRFIYNEAGDSLFIDMLHEDYLALPNASGGNPFA